MIGKWRLYTYDVWGNDTDGYEVNDVFRTDTVYTFPDDLSEDSEFGILQCVMEFPAGRFKIDQNVNCADTIYIQWVHNGKPACELRLEG